MEGLLSWVQNNWSSAIGAFGIVGGLLFTAASFREDSKQRQISNLMAIDERHQNLWREAHQRQDLQRVFLRDVGLDKKPMSVAESEFISTAILQFETGWRIERLLNRGELKLLASDAADFLSLPLPRAVWEKSKTFRNQQFVRFVEKTFAQIK